MKLALAALLLLAACAAPAPEPGRVEDLSTLPARSTRRIRLDVLFVERADGLWEVHVPTPTGCVATVARDENDAKDTAERVLREEWSR